MDGPMKLYKLKPIVRHNLSIKLPNCMYKMKSIDSKITRNINGVVVVEQQSSDHVSITNKNLAIYNKSVLLNNLTNLMTDLRLLIQNNENIQEMAELEARQEGILKELADLKKQMDSIKQHLKIEQNTQSTTNLNQQTTVKLTNLPNIVVVNVNPTNPPYSLVILQKLLQNQLYLKVETATHSSINQLSDEVKNLEAILTNFQTVREVPKITIKLIWKDVEADSCEFLVAYSPVFGEVNLLRYLVRLTNSHLNYDSNQIETYEIDALLDNSYRIMQSKTKTERVSLLQRLSKSLSKAQWLAGRSDVSLADIANYSAIKQNVPSNEINVNLTKWLQRCEEVRG